MHAIMVQPLPLRCRLTAIFDVSQIRSDPRTLYTLTSYSQSCHSGTLLGLSMSSSCNLLTYDIPRSSVYCM
jgi:hypothetical protein